MRYKIIKSKRKTLSLEIKNGELLVRAPKYASKRQIENFLSEKQEWIKKHMQRSLEQKQQAGDEGRLSDSEIKELVSEAKKIIPERVAYYAPLVGVNPGRITIRMQKTRWGSASAIGNLNFNCLLMLAPSEVLDSVVVHELCHLKVMNHSQDFYREVYRVFPDYKKYNKWLKDNGSTLMMRAFGA